MGPRGPGGEPVLHSASAGLSPERAAELVAAAAPGVDIGRAVTLDDGWDSLVLDTGEWIFKFPRRPDVEPAFRAEIALLRSLAGAVPLEVPRFEVVVEEPVLFAGYRKIPGAQLTRDLQTESAGRDLAGFLVALHAFPVDVALGAGVPGGAHAWRAQQEELVADLHAKVSPLLPERERDTARAAFVTFLAGAASFDFEPALIHYDVGPTHLLARGDGSLAGVIDWGDAWVGDPAADLAWALEGSTPAFARAVADAYPATEALRDRGAPRPSQPLPPPRPLARGRPRPRVERPLVGRYGASRRDRQVAPGTRPRPITS